MTPEEQRQYQLGGEMMRERLIALIHHYYTSLKTFHGPEDDRCALLRNIRDDIRADQEKEFNAQS